MNSEKVVMKQLEYIGWECEAHNRKKDGSFLDKSIWRIHRWRADMIGNSVGFTGLYSFRQSGCAEWLPLVCPKVPLSRDIRARQRKLKRQRFTFSSGFFSRFKTPSVFPAGSGWQLHCRRMSSAEGSFKLRFTARVSLAGWVEKNSGVSSPFSTKLTDRQKLTDSRTSKQA